jgi:hypothetical protein
MHIGDSCGMDIGCGCSMGVGTPGRVRMTWGQLWLGGLCGGPSPPIATQILRIAPASIQILSKFTAGSENFKEQNRVTNFVGTAGEGG